MAFTRLAKYAWAVLLYNIAVILWGAYVRASGSGAGCGSHWPLCNGEVIPRAPQVETIIEFTHRAMSGLAFLLVVILAVWIFRTYPKRHILRLGAGFSLLFIITEALVGAGLVLFQWVAQDSSIGRAISIVVHLINTFMLLAFLALTAWWASGGRSVRLLARSSQFWIALIGLLGIIVLGASGALAALGDTLFPVGSLAEGIQQDFSPTAHFLVRLRLLHPSIAVLVSIYLIIMVGIITAQSREPWTRSFGRVLRILVVIQLGAGLLNVYLLAPVWMQIVHLLLADAVWIALILFFAANFAIAEVHEPEETSERSLSYAGSG